MGNESQISNKDQKKRGNPNWQRGGSSPHPQGRRVTSHSVKTPKGMLLRFINRNLTPRKLQTLYDELTAKDKLSFLVEVLPCVTSKMPTQVDMTFEKLSDRDIDVLYNQLMSGIQFQMQPVQIKEPLMIEQ